MLGKILYFAIERIKRQPRVTLVVIHEVDAAAIGGPLRFLHVAIELRSRHPRIASIAIHQIQVRRLMPLVAVVESNVSDRLAIRRNRRRAVRSLARGKRLYRSIRKRELVDLGIQRFILVLWMQVGREDQVFSVGSPRRPASSANAFTPAVREITAGELPWRATF